MTFAPTQCIENYEIIEVVERRRTGIAYKARNVVTGKLELLRTLAATGTSDREASERFLREVKVQTRLCHPNIVAFYDARQVDGQLFMTSEYVEGATLAERVAQGPLEWREAVRVASDLLSALEEAHALGIVHRGISPEHVIVTADGVVKLGGFGLAKPVSDLNLTQAGSVLGDAKYMSPEQVTNPASVDSRADLYSVGILLFEAITGKPPFAARSDYETMVAQVQASPPVPSTLAKRIPGELDGLILRALAKDPAERFQTAQEFREALQEIGQGGPPPAEPQVEVQQSVEKRGLAALLDALLGLVRRPREGR